MGLYDNLPSPSSSGVTTFGQAMGNPPVGSHLVGQISGVSDPLAQLRQRATTMFHDSQRQQQAQQIAAGQSHASGFQGLLQDVMSNPIVKTVMKPLELLDYGRRGVISTVKEVGDLVTGNHASLQDWWNQTNDPTFGFGKIIPKSWQHNKWAGRIIGFLGDVALDPLTYVTLGGSAAAAAIGAHGAEGRLLAAGRLLDEGVVSAERAAQIGRQGLGFLTAEERAALGLQRQGLYFMGKRMAGTGSIAEAMQKSAFRARIFMGDTLRLNNIVRHFDGEELQAVRRALLDGKVPQGRAAEFFHAYMGNNVRREIEATVGHEQAQALAKLVDGFTDEELQAARNSAYRAAEGVVSAENPVSAVDQRVADAFAQAHADRINSLNQDMMYLDHTGESNFNVIENQFPHVRTPDAVEHMADLHNPYSAELRDTMVNPLNTAGAFKSRMAEGDKFFGHVLTKEDIAGGVERLNKIANEAGFKGQFFETDMIRVHGRYVAQYAQQKGIMGYMKHLFDKGVGLSMLDRQVLDGKMVAGAVDAIKSTSEQFGTHLVKVMDSVQGSLRKSVTSAEAGAEAMRGTIATLDGQWAAMSNKLADATVSHSDALASLQEAGNALYDAHQLYDKQLGADKPLVWYSLHQQIVDAQRQLKNIGERMTANGALQAEDEIALKTFGEAVTRMSNTERILSEHGNRIEQALHEVIKGKSGEAIPNLAGNDLWKNLPREDGVITDNAGLAKALRGSHRVAATIDGTMNEVVDSAFANSEWLAKANTIYPITKKEVRNLSLVQVSDIAGRAVAGNASLQEMRAATIWMLARAEAIHGGLENMPESLQHVLRTFATEDGKGILDRAAEAQRFDTLMNDSAAWQARGVRIDTLHTNYAQIDHEVSNFAATYIEAKLMSDRIGARIDDLVATTGMTHEQLMATEVPLEQFIQEVGHDSPLSDVFAKWIDDSQDPTAQYERLMQPDNIAASAEAAPVADMPTLTWGEVVRSLKEVDAAASSRRWTMEAATADTRKVLMDGLEPDKVNELNLGEIALDMQDSGKQLQVHFHFNKQLKTRIDRELGRSGIDQEQRIANALAHVDQRLKGLRESRSQLKKWMKEEFGGLTLSGTEATQTQRASVDAIKRSLGDGMHQLWFNAQVEERWQKVLGTLAPYHLVPTAEHYRNVVNMVAQEALDGLGNHVQAANDLTAGLAQIRNVLDTHVAPEGASAAVKRALIKKQGLRKQVLDGITHDLSTADGMRAYIGEEFAKLVDKHPSAARLLSLHGGDEYARELLDRVYKVGGATGDNAAAKAFKAEQAAAGLSKIGQQETYILRLKGAINKATGEERTAAEAALADAQAELTKLQEAQPMLEAANAGLVAKRDAYVAERKQVLDTELREWYKRHTGDTSNRTSYGVMHTRLKEHIARIGGTSWRDTASTQDDMYRFINGLYEDIQGGTSQMRQQAAFYRQAADPWADVSSLMVDGNTHQLLPRAYVQKLNEHADMIENMLARHEKFQAESRRLGTAATEAETSAALMAKRTRALETGRGVTQELFGSDVEAMKRVSKLWNSVHDAQSTVEFQMADQVKRENEVLGVLAHLDHNNAPVSLRTMQSQEQAVREAVTAGADVFAIPSEPRNGVYKTRISMFEHAQPVDEAWLAQNAGDIGAYSFFKQDPNMLPSRFADGSEQAAQMGADHTAAVNKVRWLKQRLKLAVNDEERFALEKQLKVASEKVQKLYDAAMEGYQPIGSSTASLMVDGQPLTFSPTEFESLFRSPAEPVNKVERAAIGREYKAAIAARDEHMAKIELVQQGADRMAVTPEIEAQAKRVGRLKRIVREGEGYQRIFESSGTAEGTARGIPSSWSPAAQVEMRNRLERETAYLTELQDKAAAAAVGQQHVVEEMYREAKAMQAHINELEHRYKVLLADTRKEAMRKVRLVVAKMDEEGSGVSIQGLMQGMVRDGRTAESLPERLNMIQKDMWEGTPHAAVYDRVKAVQQQAEYGLMVAQQDQTRMAVDEAVRVRAAANEAERHRMRQLTGSLVYTKDGELTSLPRISGIADAYASAAEQAQAGAAMTGVDISNLMHGYAPEGPMLHTDLSSGSDAVVKEVKKYPKELRAVAEKIAAAPAGTGKLVEVDPELIRLMQHNGSVAEAAYNQALGIAIGNKRAGIALAGERSRVEAVLEQLNVELKHTAGEWDSAQTEALRVLGGNVESEATRTAKAYKKFVKASTKLDAMSTLATKTAEETSTVSLKENLAIAEEHIKNLTNEIEQMQTSRLATKDAVAAIKPVKGEEVASTVESLAPHQHMLDVAKGQLEFLQQLSKDAHAALEAVGKGESTLADKMVVSHFDQLYELTKQHGEITNLIEQLPKDGADNQQWMRIEKGLLDGWVALGDIHLPNMMMSEDLWKALQGIRVLKSSASSRELLRFLKPYTAFFKTYSTLSPGFHLRNGMSNAMQYLAAGGDIRLMRRGAELAMNYMKHDAAGTLEEFFKGMTAADRGVFDAALKATRAAGGGRIDDQLAHLAESGKLLKNTATIASRNFGHKVEFVGRFMLAHDTIVSGAKEAARAGTELVPEQLWQTAAARVKRYMFDYLNPSHVDDAVRQIVPFWTWMSRNLPTQLVNQWVNPRAYAIYNSLVRNIGMDNSNYAEPQWLKEAGAVRLSGDTFFTPDWGMTKADQVLSELGDPARMGSYVNPLLRVPVELLGSRRLYNNQPFAGTPQQVMGGPAQPLVEQLLGLVGATRETGPRGVMVNGKQTVGPNQTVTSDKWNYALMNLLPMLSQAERLAPATEGYKAKSGSSWLGYLGIPVREVSQSQKDAEIARRTKELQQLAANAKKLGYTP